MKKIYILTAVFALLTLSLNAQDANTNKATASTKGQATTGKVVKSKRISLNDMLCGIKGMSSILPESNPVNTSSARPMRAPLKINSDETTVGPFTGDNFDDDGGLGFGGLYPNNQDIRVATILERSEFAQHNGDQLVGFRFALAGQTSTNNQVKVYDFFSWPVGTNGYFETANRLTWNLGDWSTASTDYQLINNDLTSTNFSTGSITTSAPWTATSVNNQSNGSFYILSGGNLKFTVPSGYSNADFKFSLSTRGSYYAGTFVFTPSTGSAQTLTTSAANTVYECELTGLSTGDVVTITGTYGSYGYSPDFTYMHVYAKGGTANYMTLTGGQWYEYYLDEPIDFVVNDSIDELFLGYSYEQYPSSSTSELRYPMGVNPESTTHDHAAWLYYPNSSTSDITITVPGNTVNFSSIRIYDTSNNLLTSWYSTSTNTGTTSNSNGGTSTYYIMPDGWTVENAYMFQYGSSGSYTGYVSSSDEVNITISQDALNNNTTVNVVIAAYDDNGNVTMSVNGVGKTISTSTSGTYTWSNVELATTTYDYGLYGFDFSQYGDLAVQLIFKSSEPELISPEDGSTVNVGTNEGSGVSTTIPVSGHNLTGDLTVSVSGTGFSVSPTTISAADANAGTSVTVTYNGTDPNATGTLTITSSNGEVSTVNVNLTASYVAPVPELTAPTDGSTVNVGTNPGAGVSTTITVSGLNLTSDLTISVEGTGFSVEPTTISAADANAGTTITVTYNGYSAAGTGTLTITSSNGEVEPVTVNLTGNFVPQPIEPVTGLLRLHLLLVDQLKANIPDDNSHADSYRYVLKYEPTGGETKESSPAKVDIHKTECEVKGYYTQAQIVGDTDGTLDMDVLTADVEFNLTDDDNTIDFYNLQGKPNEYPALGDDYLTKLQQTTGFVYYEMLEGSPNKGDDYPAGLHHYYDDSTPILTGTYTNGFMSYAPSLSTFGVERRYYEDDGLDNTYGAPIWRTRVGKVEVQTPEIQKQVINAGTPQEANNPHTTWTVGNKTYCLYFLGVNAQGTLPRPYTTDYPQGTNIKYEPYMFRVFVSSQSGKLRKFDRVLNPNGGGYEAVDAGPIGANEKYCVGSFYKNEGWTPEEMFFHKPISAQNTTNGFADDGGNDFDPYAWDGIMKFGAEDGIMPSDVKVWVRFYYMVEGWDATRDGEARPGNGSEGSGDPGAIGTYIFEYQANAEVVGVTYVNAQGMTSDKPFDGMNIVVTKFSDGTTTTTKVMR